MDTNNTNDVNNYTNDANNHSNNVYNATNNVYNVPEAYRPISMWGYFGYQLLFAIPCVGIILILVFSFGGTTNLNLRNFARSYFCILIICVVLGVLISIIGVTTGLLASL